MEVPVRWLREYVDTDLDAMEIARKLTMAGLEAEKVTTIGEHWGNCYIGLVERVERHPDADRLVLATVNAGEHQLTVVTGAPNIAEGQKVVLALAGAQLWDAYSDEPKLKKLKPSSIRGIRSEGMVCSEKELGLSDEHEGILVLEDEAPVGTAFREWYGDDVIEFEITPNRVDAFSMVGIARDLAALLEQPYRLPGLADLTTVKRADESITIDAPEHCGRYSATLFENVTVEPSPTWLQRRIIAAGMRPVNNYVDISNYVMWEVGHPTHPFDANLLASNEIVVRLARPNEVIETIDHVRRELDPETLVIADREKAVGIAGIMGGVGTEITEETKNVLLEAAWFVPSTIRRSTRMLKLNTDASARFVRDIDPNGAEVAARRFIQLVNELDPGATVVQFADQYVERREPRQVVLEYKRIERLLGMSIPLERCLEILERLGLSPSTEHLADDIRIVTEVPTFRNDIEQAADLIEEIVRIDGYDHLPEAMMHGTAAPIIRDPARLVDQVVQNALVEAGLQEVQTYTMVSDDDLIALTVDQTSVPSVIGGFPRPEADFVRATNPLRSDWTLMRPTLMPSLMKIVAEDRKYSERVAIFETARTYQPTGEPGALPDERRTVSIAMTGNREPFGIHEPAPTDLDFFDLKGCVELMLTRLGVGNAEFVPVEHPSLQPGRTAALQIDGIQVGVLVEVHPAVSEHFEIESRLSFAEIDLESFASTLRENWQSAPVGRFQPVHQDFAIVVDESVSAGQVREALVNATYPLGSEIRLFDVYRGAGLEDGTKSLAYRITFTAPDREIADHERERIRTRIEKTLKKQVGGTLRT